MYRDFFGVDFSGAKEGAQKQLPLWVARGTGEGAILKIERLLRLESRAHLTEEIQKSKNAIWGIDFPFSFPEAFLKFLKKDFRTVNTWLDLLRDIKLGELKHKIDDFRKRRKAGEKHPLRYTECDFKKVVLSSLNERMFRMVFHGMRLLVNVRGDCDVLPWDSGTKTRVIIEIFPGATVDFLGCDAKGYKGKGADKKSERRKIIKSLLEGKKLGFSMDFAQDDSDNFKSKCYTYDDALDAVVAVATVFWCCQKPDRLKPPVGWNQLEGWIFGPGR